MARKLIHGNEILGFISSTGTITVRGHVPISKLLLINNATINTILYNFSDPNLTATCNYDSSLNQTTISLSNYNQNNFVGISNSDNLQIYYEKEELEIKPTRTYRDPVSKFRVSTPETLIDTDFEYGLQPTKWETLKLVNNIPTSYSVTSTDEALTASSVLTTKDSYNVTVVTNSNHNLIAGSIIEIVGLNKPIYEGTYIVSKTPDPKTFSYKTSFKASSSQILKTDYTLIYPGAFYTGSSIDVADVSTDQVTDNTTLTLTTPYYHGLKEKTKVYLKKSRATISNTFSSPNDVVAVATTSYKAEIKSSITSPESEYYSNTTIITDDYIGEFEINLDNASLNTGNGVISYNLNTQVGLSAQTPIKTGDIVVFYTPTGNALPTIGGGGNTLQRFTPLHVITATNTSGIVTFTVAQIYGSTTVASINVGGSNTTFGNHRFLKGFKVQTVTASDQVSCASSTTFINGDNVVAISTFSNGGGGSSNFKFTKTLGQQPIVEGTNFRSYTISNIVQSTTISGIGQTFTLNNNPNSGTSILNFTSGTSNFIALVKLKSHPLSNSVYLPPSVGFSTIPFPDGFYATYSCTAANSSIGGLVDANKYHLKKITGNTKPNWYQFYSPTDTTLSSPINLYYNNDAFVGNVINTGIHTVSGTVDRDDQHTISIKSPPRGNVADNTNDIIYASSFTAIGGLISNNSYRAKTSDKLIDSTQLRLSNPSASGITSIHSLSHTANSSTAIINLYTNASSTAYPSLTDCGIAVGGYLQVSGFDAVSSGSPDGITLNDIWQGIHKVTAIGNTSANICPITVQLPSWKNITNAISIPNTNQNLLKSTSVCGIITFTSQGGSGIHLLSQNTDGIIDDLYFIDSVSSDGQSFTIKTNSTVPKVIKTISAVNTGSSDTSSIKVTAHNFADGTLVQYITTGSEIGGLTNNNYYYIRVLDANFVALSSTADGAIDRTTTSNLIALGSSGSGTQSFTTNSVKGFLTGAGTVGFTSQSPIITGTNTKFFTDFSNGDLFRIYKLTNTGSGPGTYFESKVVSIKSDDILKMEKNPSFDSSSSNYFVGTRLYAVSDGKAIHRPFDGGVTMTTGLIPNTQVIRQTRKYFRYQSGKGIQVSKAVNFNPTFDIDTITAVGADTPTWFKINTKYPHQISERSVGSNQRIKLLNVTGQNASSLLNKDFQIVKVDDDFNFTVDFATTVKGQIEGFVQYNVVNWQDSAIKCGMYDDQNGFFFKYNGSTLYAVRRSSTQQLSGAFSVERNSHRLYGSESILRQQIKINDKIVVRGQTYKVTNVISDSIIDIQPAYRGGSASNIIVSKVIDTEIPQNQWNLDKMDGTGESGYDLDINKIQMIYMDYSWYGAGSIRFGFKDQYGEVRYCHEFIHNNSFTESYFRSGNIPARYEVETYDNPLFAPSLFHWGVSVIMDGRFDDDKAYLFTAESSPLPYTNGGFANKASGPSTDGRPTGTTTIGSNIVSGIDASEAAVLTVGETIVDSASATTFPTGTTITGIEIDQSSEANKYGNIYSLTVSNPATSSGSKKLNIFSGTSTQLQSFIPLVSIRLAPAVDNATTSSLGFRDIINRMQLTLKSAGVLTTHDCEVRLIFNAKLSNDSFTGVGSPSLSQIYKHQVGDSFTGGTRVFAFRAQGGGIVNATTGRRTLNGTDVSLSELALLGNSILGGDGVFPDGPDILTVAVKPVDTSQITGSSPFIATGRITWAEAQA